LSLSRNGARKRFDTAVQARDRCLRDLLHDPPRRAGLEDDAFELGDQVVELAVQAAAGILVAGA
jgi:hypothetical protein